ncbi:hypothetical protein EGT07_13510 [Herbaspirillum sp. HC18]|nr:hypothetical protein EGT07_13510 [Herbaspirillum sp. HC18]
MQDREFKLRAIVVLGWSMMFMVLLAMFVTDLARSAIAENFSDWAQDMSYGGLLVMLVVMSFYVFMPMLVLTVGARWFRFFVVGITALMTLFFIAHEIAHLLAGDMPFGVRHVLDFSHHILGVWVTAAAMMWARMPVKDAVVTTAFVRGA